VKSELDDGSDMQQPQLGVKCQIGLRPFCVHFCVHLILLSFLDGW
jgi:hypothetical protein